MVRIVKFRGYSQEKGWVYGDLNQYSNGECYITEHSDGQDLSYPVAPASVGQFTGLVDKHGTEIYEGDILESEVHKAHYVGFCDGAFELIEPNQERLGLGRLSIYAKYIEVIGNRHDINNGNEEVQG